MTQYLNPSTRLSGAKQILVGERTSTAGLVQEPPVDGGQYTWRDGEWVDVAPEIAEINGTLAQVQADLADANVELDEAQVILDGIDAKVAQAKAEAIAAAELDAQEKADLAEAAAIAQAVADAAAAYDGTKSLVQTWTATDQVHIDGGALQADSVTTLQLAADSVEANNIKAGAVVAGKLAADSVLAANIKAGEIGANHIAANQISAVHIVGESITSAELAANSVIAGKIAANAVVAGKIAANAVTADKINASAVTADKIAANAVTAAKLEANLILTTDVIAGNPSGAHARLNPDGFRSYKTDVEGELVPSIRIGDPSGELITLMDTDGVPTVNISDDGTVSSRKLVADELELDGEDILGGLHDYAPAVGSGALMHGHLDKIGRGIVAFGLIPSGNTLNSNDPFYRLTFVAEPGRSYRVTVPPVLCYIGQTNRPTGFYLAHRTATTHGGGTLGSNRTLQYAYVTTPNTSYFQTIPGMTYTLRCNQGGVAVGGDLNAGLNEVFLGSNANATATIQMYTYGGGVGIPVTVEDVGLDFPSTGAWVYGGSGSTQQVYTTVWEASNSRAYNQNGTTATGSGGATIYDMPHGPYTSGNNRHSLAVFAGGSVSSTSGSEVGKTIATALSGATVEAVEVYLYANHWYHSTGGEAHIRTYNSTSVPSSLPAPGSSKVTSPGWPKPGGRWVDITAIATSAVRGVIVGATGTTSTTTYGRFNGATQANKPKLRIRYRR